MASVEAIKKPQTAYFLWMNANRENIQEVAGAKDFKTVAAKASEMWKAATAAQKAPHEKEAKRQKDAYDAFVATPEGQKALDAKKAEKKEEKQAKQEKEEEKRKMKEERQIAREKRECKAAVKAVEKDERLKKPLTAYFLWLNENRARITAMLGGKGGAQVAAKGSEMWKKASETERKPYEDRAKKEKEEYDAYIQSPAGAAALKAYKEATAALAYKEKPTDAENEDEDEDPKQTAQKRKIEEAAAVGESGANRAKRTKSAKAGA